MLRHTPAFCGRSVATSALLRGAAVASVTPSFMRAMQLPSTSSSSFSAAAASCPTVPVTARATAALRTCASASGGSASGFDTLHPLHNKLDALIKKGRIVVFLTGSPSHPQCGFTGRMVDLLEQLPIDYEYVNIMEDEEIIEGLKSYSGWPTFPQLYIDGELVGGFDITRQMVLDGSLVNELSRRKLLKH